MKAAIVPRYGPPDTIQFTDTPAPDCGIDEVLIDVFASGVTQGDRRMRAGDFPGIIALLGRAALGFRGPRKQVPGSTFAGRIRQIGHNVTRFTVGDDVFGECMSGGQAEQLVMPQGGAIGCLPRGVTHSEATALPYGVCTANAFLADLGQLKSGERAVIIGAGGGVGRYAVQIAASLGAHVIAVCSERHHERVLALGADEVVCPGASITGNVDLVFDTSGTSKLGDWKAQMPSTGRFLTVDLTARVLLDLFAGIFTKGPKARFTMAICDSKQIEQIVEQLESGAVKPLLGPTFAFVELVEAHRCLEEDRPTGDVVVEMRRAQSQRSVP